MSKEILFLVAVVVVDFVVVGVGGCVIGWSGHWSEEVSRYDKQKAGTKRRQQIWRAKASGRHPTTVWLRFKK